MKRSAETGFLGAVTLARAAKCRDGNRIGRRSSRDGPPRSSPKIPPEN